MAHENSVRVCQISHCVMTSTCCDKSACCESAESSRECGVPPKKRETGETGEMIVAGVAAPFTGAKAVFKISLCFCPFVLAHSYPTQSND